MLWKDPSMTDQAYMNVLWLLYVSNITWVCAEYSLMPQILENKVKFSIVKNIINTPHIMKFKQQLSFKKLFKLHFEAQQKYV